MKGLKFLILIFLCCHSPTVDLASASSPVTNIFFTLAILNAAHTSPVITKPPKVPSGSPSWDWSQFDYFDLTSSFGIQQDSGPEHSHTSTQLPGIQETYDRGLGFNITHTGYKASFQEIGTVVPTRGFAHIQSEIDLETQYRAVDVVVRLARQLFSTHLEKQGVLLHEEELVPTDVPLPMPPKPEEIFTLRNNNFLQLYIKGSPANITGEELLHSYYYLAPELRHTLVQSFKTWSSESDGFPTFSSYLYAINPEFVNDCISYLTHHDGPFPHLKQNLGISLFNMNGEAFSLDLGQLLHRAAQLKLETAAQADLGRSLGQTSIHAEALYQGDREIPSWSTPHLMSPNPRILRPNQSPNPRANIYRTKRFIVMLAAGLLAVGALALTGTILGAYSVDQLALVNARVESHEAKTSFAQEKLRSNQLLIARRVDRMENQIKNVTKVIDELSSFVDSSIADLQDQVKFMRIAMSLQIHMEEIADEIHRTTAMIDALAHKRVTSGFASSYALHRTMKQIMNDAAQQGNVLLIDNYGDVFQCDASFILNKGRLRISVHIPMGRNEEKMSLWSFVPYPFTGYDGSIVSLDSDHRMLAVNTDLSLFRGFSQDELDRCNRMGTTYICPTGTILRSGPLNQQMLSKDPDLCLYAMYSKAFDLLPAVCQLSVTPPKTTVARLTHDTFRVATQASGFGSVRCGVSKAPVPFVLSHNFDIQLEPDCTASFLSFHIFGGDLLQYPVELVRTVYLDWDPAFAVNLVNAGPRLARHASSLASSLMKGEFLPNALHPEQSLTDLIANTALDPVSSVIGASTGPLGLILAVVALCLALCGCCCCQASRSKAVRRMADNVYGSALLLAHARADHPSRTQRSNSWMSFFDSVRPSAPLRPSQDLPRPDSLRPPTDLHQAKHQSRGASRATVYTRGYSPAISHSPSPALSYEPAPEVPPAPPVTPVLVVHTPPTIEELD